MNHSEAPPIIVNFFLTGVFTMARRMEGRRKASLLWRSLPRMRRYLEANRRAKSAVSTGYREPNLLQKTVSEAFVKPETQRPGAAVPPNNPGKTSA